MNSVMYYYWYFYSYELSLKNYNKLMASSHELTPQILNDSFMREKNL